jgi:Protein of unknown function (DUF3828)
MSALAAALLFASGGISAADQAALDAATRRVYAPYRAARTPAPWQRGIWTSDLRQLIAKWQTVVPEGEVDAMNDGDWLCQCQDWDKRRFRAKVTGHTRSAPDRAEVSVSIDLGHGELRKARLAMRREQGRWLIADYHAEPYPEGIKAALIETIAEDEALLKARR